MAIFSLVASPWMSTHHRVDAATQRRCLTQYLFDRREGIVQGIHEQPRHHVHDQHLAPARVWKIVAPRPGVPSG